MAYSGVMRNSPTEHPGFFESSARLNSAISADREISTLNLGSKSKLFKQLVGHADGRETTTKKETNMIKFKQDSEYSFLHLSEDTFVLSHPSFGESWDNWKDSQGTKWQLALSEYVCKWEYNNYSGFSNYEKPYTDIGERATFCLELVYKANVEGKTCWMNLLDNYWNFKTKKEMVSFMDELMAEYTGEKERDECRTYNCENFKIMKQQKGVKNG